ncbi:MAG TPA: LamG-like jellyroll fold domain-containing protein, partial [Pirellulales bacterium]|nr:LamG-like jellyroll fold domain-containing protein [Pirellulales bacterium]
MLIVAMVACASAPMIARPADPVDEPQNDSLPPVVSDARALARWSFDAKDDPGAWKGKKRVDQPGPRQPLFPNFSSDNLAARFGDGAQVVLVDDSPDDALRFDQGDSITIEAWVNVHQLKAGQYAYLIGKGRSGKKGFAEKNQNYALRLKGVAHGAQISFLFASRADDKQPGEWHRWTSKDGFLPGSDWHHVAVSYTFGKPESIDGYIDGRDVSGTWDMAGATSRAPVVDADDVVVGTGNGNGSSNRFDGWLDEVVVYRGIVPAVELQKRFAFVPPPAPIERASVPAGRVLVQLCDVGLPANSAWPAIPPQASETYSEEVFGLVDMPRKYVDSGVRGDRGNPSLLRAAARVKLPKGTHRLLIRARNASRLFIDDKQMLITKFQTGDSGGHGRVKKVDDYLDLGPDFRFAPSGENEAWTSFESPGGEHFVVFEVVVGGAVGKGFRRPELGETVVAISREGSESWELLSPGQRRVAYTDDVWPAYAAERRAAIETLNAQARAAVRAQHASYWQRRQAAAQAWLNDTAEVK